MDNENLIFPSNMENVFGMLSTGYHLCIEDGDVYNNLVENEIFYRKMFKLLGFNLSDGSDSVYYFLPNDEKINEISKRFMVFIAIMYDWLADQGKEPVSYLTEGHFYFDELPHLSIEQYKKTMGQLDINERQDLLKVIKGLERYGFLELIDNSMIKFRKTISRFVKIFSDVSQSRNSENIEGNIND